MPFWVSPGDGPEPWSKDWVSQELARHHRLYPKLLSSVMNGIVRLTECGQSRDTALVTCLACLHVAFREFPGALTSQKGAFRDLVEIYADPYNAGEYCRPGSMLGFSVKTWKMRSGPRANNRLIYEIEDGKPVNIRMPHHDDAYAYKKRG